jgi:hypothetical protein
MRQLTSKSITVTNRSDAKADATALLWRSVVDMAKQLMARCERPAVKTPFVVRFWCTDGTDKAACNGRFISCLPGPNELGDGLLGRHHVPHRRHADGAPAGLAAGGGAPPPPCLPFVVEQEHVFAVQLG